MKNNHIGRGLATIAAAAMCSVMLWQTQGQSGIGWFIIALIIIWGL
jgi:hypothetical protein